MSEPTTDFLPVEHTPTEKRHLALGALVGAGGFGFWLYQLLSGALVFASSWAVMLGVVVALVIFFWPTNWLRTIAGGFIAWVLIAWVLPAGVWQAGFNAGGLTALGVACGGFAAISLLALALPVTLAWVRRRRDKAADEAAAGIALLDSYLAKAAETLGPHTLAKMQGAAVEGRKVIGLSGYGGSGKDTAAAGLIFERDYAKVSLSNKLREFALAVDPIVEIGVYASATADPVFGVTTYEAPDDAADDFSDAVRVDFMRLSEYLALVGERDSDDWPIAKKQPDVRRLLQRTGTDAGRRILGENVWVDACMADLPDGPVIFTSVRFINEAEAIKAQGGYLVRVERPGVGPVNDHPSETAMDDWDYDASVLNDGDMKACREQMLKVESVLYDSGSDAA